MAAVGKTDMAIFYAQAKLRAKSFILTLAGLTLLRRVNFCEVRGFWAELAFAQKLAQELGFLGKAQIDIS